MGSMTIHIPDQLEYIFRTLAREKFGDRKGRLSEAATEALYFWCKYEEKLPKK